MGTTTRRKTAQRRPGGRLRPDFEPLELRMVMSGSSLGSMLGLVSSTSSAIASSSTPSPWLSVVSTTPASSAVLASSPSTLQVTFDRPLDGFLVGSDDFELVHVASDGSTSPMLPGEASLGESLDADGRQIDLTLSEPLIQGHYRLLLNPDSQIQGVDGSTLDMTGAGLVVSDFTFSPPQDGLGSAVDLGVLGPQESTVPGQLDLASDPGAVQYYKFEVATGHHWLVGLEISSHRDGGTLDSSLSLFDAQGHLISTANEGLSGDPDDPYLFAGLDPGTYYVGVAAMNNLPDASGAYDPSASEVNQANPGGPFQLDVVADEADQPTQLLGLRLDQADPLSTSPTGLTLQFSGGLAVTSFANSSDPSLALVDQSGATWSLTPIHYDPNDGQLSLAFDRPLAPGTYTLELTGPSSLLDLAGRIPVAEGLPAGTLGSFVVAPSKPVAGDLGPILPGFGASGLSSTVTVTPGRATTEHFLVIEPGVYAFDGVAPGSGVQFSVEDGSGNVLATGPGISASAGVACYLEPGAYQVVLTTVGTQPATTSLAIVQRINERSSLLESGVAQGPALNLRLVTPQADFGQGSSTPTNSTNSPTANPPTTPFVGVSSASAGVSTPSTGDSASLMGRTSPAGEVRSVENGATVAVGLAVPSGPSVVGLTVGGGPVGRPFSQASPIGVVGPSGSSGPTGLASIASSSDDLPAGLILTPASLDEEGELEPEASPIAPEIQAERSKSPRAGVTLEAGLLAQAPGSRREDDRTLAEADWIGQLLAGVFEWSGGPGVDAGTGVEGVEPSPAVPGPRRAIRTAPLAESRTESASVASPFAIGVVLGAVAFGSRRALFRRKVSLTKPLPKTGLKPLLAGPHRRSRVMVH
jgi:methionine-rich copper-binding protein CopC